VVPVLITGVIAILIPGAIVGSGREEGLDRMLGSDEADYVRAMEYGLTANYLGTRERSGVEFVSEVLREYRQTGWARPFDRDWRTGDAAGLRHYHSPVAFYPVAAVLGMGVRDEHALRLVPFVTGALGLLAAVLLSFELTATLPVPVRLVMSAIAGVLSAASPYHLVASHEISPHAAFALFSCLSLFGLTRTLRLPGRFWWIFACAATSLAALTVPYWVLLLPPVAWTWWRKRRTHSQGASVAAGLVTAVLVALLAWPPFVLEVGFVKPILMYGGILLRPLQSVQTPGTWLLDLAQSHPVMAVLGLAGLTVLVKGRGATRWAAAPTLIFAVGFLVLNLRVGHMKPLYASDAVLPLAALACSTAGAALVAAAGRWAPVAAAGILIASVLAFRPVPPAPDGGADWRRVTAALEQQFSGERILVTPRPAGAVAKYYWRRTEVVLDSGHPNDVPAISQALTSGRIAAIVQWGRTFEPGGAAKGAVADRPKDGTAEVSGTTVSWWWQRP
jgi:hypothetical protein